MRSRIFKKILSNNEYKRQQLIKQQLFTADVDIFLVIFDYIVSSFSLITFENVC